MWTTRRDNGTEVLLCAVAFWRFLFSGAYRRRALASFRAAGGVDRMALVFYSVASVLTGLVALAIVAWIVVTL
jgi:hypothetical protein